METGTALDSCQMVDDVDFHARFELRKLIRLFTL